MDQFDTVILHPDDARLREFREKCICRDCPTYNSCAGDSGELLYCFIGKSFRCITEDLGCVCPSCPLVDEAGLEYLTFCLLGSEAAQRYDRDLLHTG